jgi:hypothetical protein
VSLISILRKCSGIASVDYVSTGILKTLITLSSSVKFVGNDSFLRMVVNLKVEPGSSRRVKMLQTYTKIMKTRRNRVSYKRTCLCCR